MEKREVIKTEEQQQHVCKVDQDYREDEFLPGFRFHPTDQELVGFYLKRKVEKKEFCIELIKEIDIYKHEPWDLPRSRGEKEWYFFCLRGRKYRNSVRPNRVTGSGFWKATGIDKPIYSSSDAGGECVGLKKSLVYYKGSAGKGVKTDWMMHEFRLPSSSNHTDHNGAIPCMQEAEVWTLCRIIKRNASSSRPSRISWKASSNVTDSVPSDSSSKTSSFESDSSTQYEHKFLVPSLSFPGTEMKCNGSTYAQNNVSLTSASQYWNSMPQVPSSPTITHFNKEPDPNFSDDRFFENGDWDELGRVVAVDQNGKKSPGQIYCPGGLGQGASPSSKSKTEGVQY